MKSEFDGSSLRSALRTAGTSLLSVFALLYASVRSLAATARSRGETAVRLVTSRGLSVTRRLGSTLTGPTTRGLLLRAWRGLVGRRPDVTAAAAFVAPVLALGTEWWVVDAYGYRQVEVWVFGTWNGSDPQSIVFLGVAALVALAAGYAAVNSGLLPSTLLVMGPVFGIGFARYGLTTGQHTVGIPNAAGVAAVLALLYGVPIGATGFVLGTILRRTAGALGWNRGGDPVPENV